MAAIVVAESRPRAVGGNLPGADVPVERTERMRRLFANVMVGGAVGAVAKTLTAPLERIKILRQTAGSTPTGGGCYTAVSGRFFSAARHVHWNQRKVRPLDSALLRGNSADCLRYIPQQAAVHAFNGNCIHAGHIMAAAATDRPWLQSAILTCAGAIAGTIVAGVCHPFDYAHVRLAAETASGSSPAFSSISDCIMTTVRHRGIFCGLYHGFGLTVVGNLGFRAVQLATFKPLYDAAPLDGDGFPNYDAVCTMARPIAVAAAAQIVALSVTYPVLVMRNRVMMRTMDSPAAAERTYAGVLNDMRSRARSHGLARTFYAGLSLEVARTVLMTTVIGLHARWVQPSVPV